MTPISTPTPTPRRFRTVLVANRGEIACRVIRTLAEMGIRSVAVYSDPDSDARHVRMADLAVNIGPPAPQRSYLNIDAIVAAAAATEADAVHPGYGFLSENAAFALACEAAGIVFIGPGVSALEMMGDKIRAKNHVAAHGVPTIVGIAEPGLSDEDLIEAAGRIGYPLLIKPSAGGGGKGMQVVEQPAQLADALVTARRIAASAFGDDTLFLEQLIEVPRHIEVQVLADNHGTVIHLGERECSLQRRHQKVIEEAPSALLDEATRARIGEAACKAAASVGYRGAGTVEFLVAASAPDEFFFMEMNTRLQVEHPVTEAVTGIDLVEWQIRVAQGEALTVGQDEVVLRGHAVEARVYAENPERGFLPTSGEILALGEARGDGIRVDSSLMLGLSVASHYDPLLSKVIAWAPTRDQALTRLDVALEHTTVLGLHTNIEYLRALLADPDVRAGNLDTSLIERRLPGLVFRRADDTILAAAALHAHARRRLGAIGPPRRSTGFPGPLWQRPTGWRMGEEHRPSRYRFAISAIEAVDVRITGAPDAASVVTASVTVADGPAHAARLRRLGATAPDAPARFAIEFDGVTRVLSIAGDGNDIWIGEDGFACELRLLGREEQLATALAGLTRADGPAIPDVRSPMPGTVISVSAATGDSVEVGQTLLTVEAMKMEHQLTATIAGTVELDVKPGDLVKLDQIVASITPSTDHSQH